jgi:DNA-binding MarR family transcriptional regulator
MPQTLKDEIGKRLPFDSPEAEAHLNLLRTSSNITAAFDRLFKDHGLSDATYNILRILRGHSDAPDSNPAGIPCQTIGRHLIARLPDVTRLVDRLEKSGLVKRSRTAGDRRVVLVGITKKGLGILADLDRPTADLHKKQLKHMTRAELAELNRLLYKARNPEG